MSYHDQSPRYGHSGRYSPSSSAAATPTISAASTAFLANSISGLATGFGGLVRRFSDMTSTQMGHHENDVSQACLAPPGNPLSYSHWKNGMNGAYHPPVHRSSSPMRPLPLEQLELRGFREETTQLARLLSTAVAEEIRIMLPERQRIEDEWNLVYSLDQDGASLGTLYKKCSAYVGTRNSFVLVVRDNGGEVFGAYLSESPHPSTHYFGNGECFLWRASLLTDLPPPPSQDTINLARATTISSPSQSRLARSVPPRPPKPEPEQELLIDFSDDTPFNPPPSATPVASSLGPTPIPQPPQLAAYPARTPSPSIPLSPLIRFKAFPYSGENEFYMYCEPNWLSIGGGDGHYGLWLNDSLEKGISSRCLTFGNDPLSDEGEKFGILGVELWLIGRGVHR